MKEHRQDFVERVAKAQSAGEFIYIAKEEGFDLTEEQANAFWKHMHSPTGEVSDDVLEQVAGGMDPELVPEWSGSVIPSWLWDLPGAVWDYYSSNGKQPEKGHHA